MLISFTDKHVELVAFIDLKLSSQLLLRVYWFHKPYGKGMDLILLWEKLVHKDKRCHSMGYRGFETSFRSVLRIDMDWVSVSDDLSEVLNVFRSYSPSVNQSSDHKNIGLYKILAVKRSN